MTNEDTVLCLCAQQELESNDAEYLQELLAHDLDWEVIYKAATQNGLLPFLQNTIKFYSDIVPATILAALKDNSFNNCARNLLQTGALVKIVKCLQADNIDTLPFKGPLLSILLYDDIGQRSFGDLDILISRDSILRAYKILLDLGYSPELQLTSQRLLQYSAHEDNLSFVNVSNQVVVELHWDLAGAYLATPLPIEEVETVPNQFNIGGCAMPGLANEYLLVYLCVHGAKHKWERLEWISSLAVLIRKNQDLDWNAILIFANAKQCKRMLLLGLLLTLTLFKVRLPENINRMIHADKRLSPLEHEVRAGIFHNISDTPVSPLEKRFSFFHMKVRDNVFDSIRFQMRLFFRPTNVEWHTVDIPAPLSFVYFIIRPFRLGLEGIRRIL